MVVTGEQKWHAVDVAIQKRAHRFGSARSVDTDFAASAAKVHLRMIARDAARPPVKSKGPGTSEDRKPTGRSGAFLIYGR